MTRRLLLLSVLSGAFACTVNLEVDPAAQLGCTEDEHCPEGNWSCNTTLGVCVAKGTNLPPTLTLETPATGTWRRVADVFIDYQLADPNGAPEGNDQVGMAVEFSLDGDTWCSATSVTDGTGIATSATPERGTFTWGALADALCLEDGTCAASMSCTGVALPLARFDTDDDGVDDVEQVGWVEEVFLRVVATDSGNPPRASGPASTLGFAIGNDPPAATLSLAPGEYREVVPIPFSITDAAFDYASIELQYRLASDPIDTWRDAVIAGGATDGILGDPAPTGAPYLVTWDSLAAPDVGRRNLVGVQLRMRASDEAQRALVQPGPWSAAATFDLRNQAAPSAQALAAVNTFDGAVTGGLALTYVLTDEESDLIDVAVEFTVDAGDTWAVATELPSSLSEGMYDLSSAPPGLAGGGGVRHYFVWDVMANLAAISARAVLRVSPSDDSGPGVPTQFDTGIGFGFDGTLNDDWAFVAAPTLTTGSSTMARFGDFDGDGLHDLVFGTSPAIAVRYGNGDGTFGPALTTPPADWADARDLVVGDFNEDGADDVLMFSHSFGDGAHYELFRGQVGSKTALLGGATAFGSPYILGEARGGDINGDGHLDVVASRNTGLEIWSGDGAGGFSTSPTIVGSERTVDIGVGDVDADGVDDVVWLTGTHRAGMDDWPSPASLRIFYGQTAPGTVDLEPEQTLLPDLQVWNRGDVNLGAGEEPFIGMELVLANLTGDGVLDMAFTESGATPRRLVVAAGSVGRQHAVSHSLVLSGEPLGLDATDHDGDGHDDLVVRVEAQTTLNAIIFRNIERLATYRALQPVFDAGLIGSGGLTRVLGADLNADGWGDMVVVRQNESRVHLANIEGQLPATQFVRGTAASLIGVQWRIASVDGDADGVEELVTFEGGRYRVSSVAARAERGFADRGMRAAATFDVPRDSNVGGRDEDLRFGDVNGDGLTDAVLYDEGNRSMAVVTGASTDGLGNGGFDPPMTMNSLTVANGGYLMTLGDITGDGLDDLIADSTGGPVVWPAAGSGGVWSGSFDFSGPVSAGFNGGVITPGNLDRDTHLDAITVSGNSMALLYGDGSGLTYNCDGDFGEYMRALSIGDIDGDAFPDIVFASGPAGSNRVRVLRGLGPACFFIEVTQNANTGVASNIEDLRLADLDGDGLRDVVGTSGLGTFVWHSQMVDGLGEAQLSAPILTVSTRTEDVVVADLDSDGVADLAVAPSTNEVFAAYGRRGSPWRPASIALDIVANGSGWVARERDHGAAASGNSIPDRFGRQRTYRLLKRPYSGLEARLRNDPRHGYALLQIVEAGLLVHDAGHATLGLPWEFAGDAALQATDSVSDTSLPSFAGTRQRVVSRLAPLVPGEGPDLSNERGIEVVIPIAEARDGVDLAAATELRLFVRHDVWLRANEFGGDVLFGNAAAAELLPQVLDADGESRDVLRRVSTWSEIGRDPDDSFTTGAGTRFILVDTPERRELRALVDQLGVFQAVYLP